MMISWMLYSIGIGALFVLAALSAESILRSACIPLRFVWGLAIALTVAFTVAAPLRASRATTSAVPMELLTMATTQPTVVAEPTLLDRISALASSATGTLNVPVTRVMDWASTTSGAFNTSLGALWLITGVAALLLLAAVYTRSMRESARWPKMRLQGRSVRVAPETGPAVMGLAPPEIVIPQWVLLRTEQEQALVLDHENEHVRARDPQLLAAACVTVALMPWNPAVWYMWSRLRLAVEVDCDQRVLKHGVKKPLYGELLVALSAQRPWNSFAMPAFSWGTSHLERRLVAMTPHRTRFATARRMGSAAVIGLSLVAACQSEMPTAAEVEAMDVAAVTHRVQRATDSTVYFVDNVATSKEQAMAIASDEIGSVEVKRAGSDGVSEIRVKVLSDSVKLLRKMDAVKADSGIVVANVRRRVAGAEIRADSVVVSKLERVVPDRQVSLQGVRADGVNFLVRSDSAPLAAMASTPCGGNTTYTGANGSRIRIRGQSSQQTVADCPMPVIILDGVRIEGGKNALQNLDPNVIERIEILKGASAMQLYGPDAANGVINITRKK
ncbi:MAG: M56 family metallopeptidase [Gemmatimonas sp.]